MDFRKIFKKRKIREEKEKKEDKEVLPEKVSAKEDFSKKAKPKSGFFGILTSPHITEKAANLAEQNQYIFKVSKKANKAKIKRAIESLYGVEVVGVKIINIPRKKRILAGRWGWRKGYKKAIAKLQKGQKIEIFSR